MTDMPSDDGFSAEQPDWFVMWGTELIHPRAHGDDSIIYAGRNPKRPTRWQRAKWIVHDDITAAREYVADLLWNLSEWIRP